MLESIENLKENNEVILRLRDITKLYAGTAALIKINMDVEKGEFHGIIGKNGAGKATLVGIISGIISTTEGSIYISDYDFKTLSRIRAKER